jgi:putative transposase
MFGLKAYYTDSQENTVENPRYLRKAEKRLKRLHRRVSRKQKHSKNRLKARMRLAKGYLKVQRQREDFARKAASTLITSCDLIAFEDLKIANMVRNRRLSKSISDVSWGKFLHLVKYYATMHDIPCIAVEPAFTTQNCSQCNTVVKKSLSVRTHLCPCCGIVLDRDHNAALNIVQTALFCWWVLCFLQSIFDEGQSAEQEPLSTVGHTGTGPSSEG